MHEEPPSQDESRSTSNTLNAEKSILPVAPAADNQRRHATDEEIKTLRHVSDKIPLAAWIVILAGAAERATYFGIIAPWRMCTRPCHSSRRQDGRLTDVAENYMQNARFHGIPGALGLGQSTATNIFNAFFLFSFLTPMAFALLSDMYIGRYRSLIVGLVYVPFASRVTDFLEAKASA